jgi:hypothetical protein
MLIKMYGCETGKGEVRYSPPVCIGARRRKIIGNPDRNLISTSYVERQNLTLRMTNRRFTRLTNAFSKKIENHKHMMAIYAMNYNFCRVHQTLRVTPAMESDIANHVWTIEEIAALKMKFQSSPLPVFARMVRSWSCPPSISRLVSQARLDSR